MDGNPSIAQGGNQFTLHSTKLQTCSEKKSTPLGAVFVFLLPLLWFVKFVGLNLIALIEASVYHMHFEFARIVIAG